MDIEVERLATPIAPCDLSALARLLRDTVDDGAAVGFLAPLSEADASAFWRDAVEPDMASGAAILFVVRIDGEVAGTVQLRRATPQNQPHRADIAKMMVSPKRRRRGIGRRLLAAAIDAACAAGKTLLTLDTRTGDPSQTLYASMGFSIAGEIPDYALDPDGAALHGTRVMYLRLG